MRIVMKGFVFALDMDKAIDSITAACSQCSALKKVLHFATQQIKFWSTWDHWQHICCWRYEARQTAYIYYAGMLFLLHYCPNNWGLENRDTSHIRSCIELRPIDGPFAVFRTYPAHGFPALVPPDLNRAQTLQECQQKSCRKKCSPVGNIYLELTQLQSGILSAVIACGSILQQFDSTRGFVCKENFVKGSSQIDNSLYRTGNSYYRNTRLAKPITPAVRDLKLLTSNTHPTPQWKSET